MRLFLKRQPSGPKATLGELYVDGKWECVTLEDVVRPYGPKIKGETAIPAGSYDVIVNLSTRFKRRMPLLLGVPQFEGVRIHTGNTDADTEGCILVGTKVTAPDNIAESHVAFDALFPKIDAALERGEPVTLSIFPAMDQVCDNEITA